MSTVTKRKTANLDNVPSPYYRVAVKALIFDTEKRLLVVLNADSNWELPGGGWEHHESLEECIRREVVEELGAIVATVGPVKLVLQGNNMPARPAIRILLPVTLEPGQLTPGDEMLEARYVTSEEFRSLSFEPNDSIVQSYQDQIW